MMITLIQFLAQPLNFAKSPLTPTLSRLRARELKPRFAAIMPSPAGGRGCATAWVRAAIFTSLPIAKKAKSCKIM